VQSINQEIEGFMQRLFDTEQILEKKKTRKRSQDKVLKAYIVFFDEKP